MGCAGGTPAAQAAGGASPMEAPATTPSERITTVTLEDELQQGEGPAWPEVYGSHQELVGHAPVVILDVGKGMKGIKSTFFKLFPRGKFMTVADFCGNDALLGKCVLLIHGGGEHKNYIGETEKEKLAEHLRRGGSLMTISAGGTFCGCNKGCLGLLPILAHDRKNWQRGTGTVKLKVTAYGQQLLPEIGEVESKYFNCPVLLPVAPEHLEAYGTRVPGLPLLTYQTEMNECHSTTSLLQLPAVLLGQLASEKSGLPPARFVVIGPNLELSPGETSMKLFHHLVAWASSGPRLQSLVTPLGEVIHQPKFDETTMTGTDRDAGELYAFPAAKTDSAPRRLPALGPAAVTGSAEGDGFTLPGNCRLLILDLGKGLEQLQDIFSPLVPVETQRIIISPKDLGESLRGDDVIFLHGGMANEHAERLGAEGRQQIRQHLQQGGRVMGVCAGAHWLSCRDLPLWGHAVPLVPHDNQNWRRGIGDVNIRLTKEGQRLLALDETSMELRYANGPLLVALDLDSYGNYQPGKMPAEDSSPEIMLQADEPPVPLATFDACSDDKVAQWATMRGHAAAWAWRTAEGGRVVALSPHPEYHQTEQSRQLFRRLLLWCVAAPDV